ATEVGAEGRMYLPLVSLMALAIVGGAAVWDLATASRGAYRPSRDARRRFCRDARDVARGDRPCSGHDGAEPRRPIRAGAGANHGRSLSDERRTSRAGHGVDPRRTS